MVTLKSTREHHPCGSRLRFVGSEIDSVDSLVIPQRTSKFRRPAGGKLPNASAAPMLNVKGGLGLNSPVDAS
jgi:hypothetical protein